MEIILLKAINLLDKNIKNDFEKYLDNEFNPHNLFICKNAFIKILSNVFEWLFKCEKKFENLKLNTFGKEFMVF